MKRLSEQNRPSETGLVLSRKAENDAFIRENMGDISSLKSKTKTVRDREAFISGYRKGHEAEIYDGIESAKEEPKRLS